MSHSSQPQDHFIRLQEVLFRIGVSRSQVYKLMEAGQFPAQIKIGYSSVWSNNAVNQWMAAQIVLSQQDNSVADTAADISTDTLIVKAGGAYATK